MKFYDTKKDPFSDTYAHLLRLKVELEENSDSSHQYQKVSINIFLRILLKIKKVLIPTIFYNIPLFFFSGVLTNNMELLMQDSQNQCDEISEKNENSQEYSHKFIYKFDDPLIQESGFVQVTNKNIIVQFPVKPDHTHTWKSMHHIQLYLNNQLIFHTHWLPILTQQDQMKFKAMFQQVWHEYTILTQYKCWYSPTSVTFMHSELITIVNKPSYYLTCCETGDLTSIEVETKETHLTSSQTIPIHIQFFIGPHLVLCSETHLHHLNGESLLFLLSFLLQKLLN